MDTLVETRTAPAITLQQMLVAREQRAARQAAALARFDRPLVSMTVVTPGPVKDGWLPRRVLETAVEELQAVAGPRQWRIRWCHLTWPETGPEALYVIDVDARLLKSATIRLEDDHPLGRLWDLDVLGPRQGPLSRRTLGCPARRCLVCERPAHECGRSRRHPLEELWSTIRETADAYGLRVPD